MKSSASLMSSLFEIGFSLQLLPLIISFFFFWVDDEDDFFGLSSFFFPLVMGFFKGTILSAQCQVINHFPKVSARYGYRYRCGKDVVSLSLLHYEIVDNDEQKGTETPPPPLKESSDDNKFFSQMAINTNCTLEISIQGYGRINLWFGIPFCS